MPFGARRIGERAEQIENRANPQFARIGADIFHRRMVVGREHKADANFVNTARNRFGRKIQMHAERFQNVRRTAFGRNGAIAVFGDFRARRRRDERRRRRDIEGSQTRCGRIAASSAGVNERLDCALTGITRARMRARESGDFVGAFAARAQCAQERRDLQ